MDEDFETPDISEFLDACAKQFCPWCGSRWDEIRWAGHGCSAQINAAGLTTAGAIENE